MTLLEFPPAPKKIAHLCFESLLENLQEHECDPNFSITQENGTLIVACKKCAEENTISLGKLMHSAPAHLEWMFRSHEGRLTFIKNIKDHQALVRETTYVV